MQDCCFSFKKKTAINAGPLIRKSCSLDTPTFLVYIVINIYCL